MRRLERWLHQHIFKVGWLLTKNLQTTTILYYTFFLPGVVLHEFVYWLMAGVLNVRAERAIEWPEAQAIAELKLNFIRLARNTGRIRVAIISIAPLVSGLALIWLITNDVLNLNAIITTIRGGSLEDVGTAISLLVSTPDVWLWVYLVFAIASTMIPDREALKGWRPILIGAGILIAVLYAAGVAQTVFIDTLATPISDGLNRLSLTFAVVIAVDLLITGVLGTIEAIIERITGDSATFQNGKLVAMTREEMLRQRDQQRAKQERQRQQSRERALVGPPSIYKLPLPIPDAPGKDLAAKVVVSRDEQSVLGSGRPTSAGQPSSTQPSSGQSPLRRNEPTMIPGVAVAKNDEELTPEKPLQEAHIPTPGLSRQPTNQDDEDDESEVEADAEDTEDETEDEEEEARL